MLDDPAVIEDVADTVGSVGVIVAGVMAALVLVASPFVTKVAEEQQEEGQAY